MKSLDYVIIFVYFALTFLTGIWYSKTSGKSLDEFFLSGRKLSWWLSGVSMVATTFAADTPLAVTGIVAAGGVAGNWFWWAYACSGTLTVFIFARLWRRIGVTTDAEFTEIRYEGKPAAFLRIFRAFYFSIPINAIIMGWVGLGMSKVIHIAFGWPVMQTYILLYSLTGIYVILSGLWGVILTDFIQFIIAMSGSVMLAWFAVEKFGSLELMKTAFLSTGHLESTFSINPFSPEVWGITFGVWLFVQWWSSWFPGAEPGGGGYIAQRIFSTRSENEAVKASLLFNVLHYVIRPWPWIIVAIASMTLYPTLQDPELGYPMIMVELLPTGLLGLLIVSFMAAFMSTLSTHLNWGASYLVSDIYKRFVRPAASDGEYIVVSRITIALLLVITFFTSSLMESVKGAWEILISVGSGTGLVYMLRWFWKRINPWSEISAMTSALVVTLLLKILPQYSIIPQMISQAWVDKPAKLVLINTIITTIVWISVTLLTKPVNETRWKNFRKRMKMTDPAENRRMILTGIGGAAFALTGIFIMLSGLNDLFFYTKTSALIKIIFALISIAFSTRFINSNESKIKAV
ncbi:MAG: Na+:solute symporter [Spirochaetia bacterium]|nr:Na+:solute symporter [Spirochaetia bacterium]